MSNHIEYGINTSGKHNRLYVDVPHDLLETVAKRSLGTYKILGALATKKIRYVDIEAHDQSARLYVNTKKIGNTADAEKRQNGIKGLIRVLNTIDVLARNDQKDPKIEVSPGIEHVKGDGRMFMNANIRWPEVSDNESINVVTYFMRDAAYKLRFERNLITESVGCDINREAGVILITNHPFAGTLCTEGNFYNPRDDIVELSAHNIYNETQQLVLFAGSVAFANAETLIHDIAEK